MKTILLADDNPGAALLCKTEIEDEGYRVLLAEDGEEAYRLVRDKAPDVVILDILMPGMDGIEVCEQIRSKPELKDTVVIAITGYEGKGLQDKVLAAGASTFVKKPVNPDQLVSMILQYTHVEVGSRPAGVALSAAP